MPMMGVVTRSSRSIYEILLDNAGFVPSATVDQTAAINAVFAECVTRGIRKFVFPPYGNEIRCDGTWSINREKLSVDLGGNEFNWRFKTTAGAAVAFTAPATTEYKRAVEILSNGSLLRRDGSGNTMCDDSWTVGIDCLVFDGTDAAIGTGRGECSKLVIDGFRYGALLGRNCYLIDFDHCWMLRNCTSIAALDDPPINTGEAIRVRGGAMWGYRIFHVKGIFLHLEGVSLDYPRYGAASPDAGGNYQYIAKLEAGAQLHMSSGMQHVEFRDFFQAVDKAAFYVGDHCVLDWGGAALYCADAAYDGTALSDSARGYHQYVNLQYLVWVTGNARAIRLNRVARQRTALFKSNSLIGVADGVTVSPPQIEASGSDDPFGAAALAGKSIAPILGDAAQLNAAGSAVLATAASFGVLADPNLVASPPVDGWHFAGSGGGIAPGQTSRLLCTNWTLAVSGNTLTATKAAGAAGASNSVRIYLPVPIQRNKVVGVKFRISKTGGAAGDVILAQIHRAVAIAKAVLYQDVWQSVQQIGVTKTLMTFTDNGAQGPLIFDTNDFAGTLDTGQRVMNKGQAFLLWLDVGVIDASAAPCVISISRVTVSEQ